MPTPYAVELRWRVICLNLLHGFSSHEVGELLCLSERTVRRYLTLFQQTGDVKPVSRRNRAQRLLELLQIVLWNPGIYLHEVQRQPQEVYRVSTICRTIKFRGCTRQVIRHVALQRSEVSLWPRYMILIWIDESGCDRQNSTRKYGYSVCGICPVDHRI